MVAFALRLTVLALCWTAFAENMEKTDNVTEIATTEEDERNSSISSTTPIIVNSESTVPTVTKDVTSNSSDVSIGQGEPKRGFSSVTSSGAVSSSSDSDTNEKRANDTGREESSVPLNDPRIFLLGENHHEDLFDQHRAALDKEGRGHENGSVHSPLVRGNGQRVGDRRSSLTSRFRPETAKLVAPKPYSLDSVSSVAPTFAHSGVTISNDHRDNSVRHSAILPRKDAFLRAFHKPRKSNSLLSHLLAPTRSTAATTVDVVTKRPTLSSKTSSPSTTKSPSPSDDDYYLYDYPDLVYNSSGYDEAGVLPEPDSDESQSPDGNQLAERRSMMDEEIVEDEEEVMESVEEEEMPVQLPDDSLVDTDLHDHDLIDSVMYIYFGPSERDQASTGRQIAAVGGVAALAAQLLTLTGVARRLKMKPNDASALILLNAELALTLANLLFMVGVQATSDRDICQRVAVGLHYLHLAVCCWLFTNSLHIYLSLRSTCYKPRVLLYCLFSWLLPIPVIMGSLGGRGYETRFYCWMSARRGMLISFMLPVSALILGNTVLTVWGVRGGLRGAVGLGGGDEGARRSLRVTAVVQPAFAVLWFLGVLALENASSLLLSLLFVTTNALLNWFIFGWWLRGEPSDEEEEDEEEEEIFEEVCRVLLKDCDATAAWRREAELQMDPICTISS